MDAPVALAIEPAQFLRPNLKKKLALQFREPAMLGQQALKDVMHSETRVTARWWPAPA